MSYNPHLRRCKFRSMPRIYALPLPLLIGESHQSSLDFRHYLYRCGHLVLTLRGAGILLANRTSIHLEAGTAAFAYPSEPQTLTTMIAPEAENWDFIEVNFAFESDLLGRELNALYGTLFRPARFAELVAYCRSFFAATGYCHRDITPSDGLLFCLKIAEFLLPAGELKQASAGERLLATAQAEVESVGSSGLSISELAERLNVTPAHLSRTFTAQSGESVRTYLLRRKFEHAKMLLTNSPASVKEIAEECGFSNSQNFCRAFKHTFGVTPKAYRTHTESGRTVNPPQQTPHPTSF